MVFVSCNTCYMIAQCCRMSYNYHVMVDRYYFMVDYSWVKHITEQCSCWTMLAVRCFNHKGVCQLRSTSSSTTSWYSPIGITQLVWHVVSDKSYHFSIFNWLPSLCEDGFTFLSGHIYYKYVLTVRVHVAVQYVQATISECPMQPQVFSCHLVYSGVLKFTL